MTRLVLFFALLAVAAAQPIGLTPPTQTVFNDNYDSTAKAEDSDLFMQAGHVTDDAVAVLTQHDKNSATTQDEDRCGPTVVFAAVALSKEPVKAFKDLVDYLQQMVSQDEDRALFESILAKLNGDSPELTYGDIGKMGEFIITYYGVEDVNAPNGSGGFRRGLPGGELYNLLVEGAKLSAPRDRDMRKKANDMFGEGASWPSTVAIGGTTPNHWILIGATPSGVAYIFDPLPMPNHRQIFSRSHSDGVGAKAHQGEVFDLMINTVHPNDAGGFDKYVEAIRNSNGAGFAPNNKRRARRDIEASY